MKLEGDFTIKAPREKVWEVLNDPDTLQNHMPGCQSLEEVGPDEYEAHLSIGISAIRGNYTARLSLTDKAPPEHYTLKVDGSGKPGFVKGEGTVRLEEDGEGTVLYYSGDLQIGGMIARVGQRMIGSIAQKMTRQFFEGIGQEIEG